MPFRLGPLEVIIILVIVIMIFGVGKLPQVTESLGRGLRSLRRGSSGDFDEDKPARESKVKVIRKLEDDEVTGKPVGEAAKDKIVPKSG